MPVTESVKTPRTIFSAISDSGEGACIFDCQYCFAKEASYVPNTSIRSPGTVQLLRKFSGDYEIIVPSCDTELFQDPETALRVLKELVPLGKDITFSTKMVLGTRTLSELSEIQRSLNDSDNMLSIMLSISMLDQSREIEIGVPSPQRRAESLTRLKEHKLFPYVGIRPLLPPNMVSDEEIRRIVDLTLANCYGYIIGPYWFKEDKFGLLKDDNLPIFRRKVQWMEDDSLWYLYEDKEREAEMERIIKERGGILYERSSEALVEIKKKCLR